MTTWSDPEGGGSRVKVSVRLRDRLWHREFCLRWPPWLVVGAGAGVVWGLLSAALVLILVAWC